MLNSLKSYKPKGDSSHPLPPFPDECKEDDLELGLKNKEKIKEENKGYLINFLVYIRDYFKK
jgi:hypothetical protein